MESTLLTALFEVNRSLAMDGKGWVKAECFPNILVETSYELCALYQLVGILVHKAHSFKLNFQFIKQLENVHLM